MKYILTILLSFICLSAISQAPFPRSSSVITPVDAHLRTQYSLGLAIYADTADYVGLDSLGTMIYVKQGNTQGLWYRDSAVGGGHIWILVNSGGSGIGQGIYFFYKTASDISTYYQMLPTPSTGVTQNITTSGVTNTQILASFATNTGFPNLTFIPAGILQFHIHAQQLSGSKTTQLYFELYKRSSAGTETLLTNTSYTTTLSGTDAEYESDASLPITDLDPTDRLVVKVRAIVSTTGSAPTIELNIENATVARVQIPQPANQNLNLLYTSQVLTEASTINMDVVKGYIGTVTLTANDTLSLTNVVPWHTIRVKVTQDATGGRTLTLPANSKVPLASGSGRIINLSTAANAVDWLYADYDGTNYYWTIANNFQ